MQTPQFGLSCTEDWDTMNDTSCSCYFCRASAQHQMKLDEFETSDELQSSVPCCKLCLAYYQLDRLSPGSDKIIHMPGLSKTALSHLIRAIHIAEQSSDERIRDEASQIRRWLLDHADYVQNSGLRTDNPVAFHAVVQRTSPEARQNMLSDLALYMSADSVGKLPLKWAEDAPNTRNWTEHYNEFKRHELKG